MGILFLERLCSPSLPTYQCRECQTDLALEKDSIGKDGESASLFEVVTNVYFGIKETKLSSGFCERCYIYCKQCHFRVGWYYYST